MNKKRIYKRLKNGKGLETFYRISDEVSYNIRLDQEGDLFQLHTCSFEGNDVFDEANYNDEKIRLFENFESLIEILEKEFPGLTFKF